MNHAIDSPPHQHLVLFIFLCFSSPNGYEWFLIMISMCIHCMANDDKHFFHIFSEYLYVCLCEMSA